MTAPDTDETGLFEASPFPHWSYSSAGTEVRFVGRIPDSAASSPTTVLATLNEPTNGVAWLEQKHSAVARRARDGACGQGDGLWTAVPHLALCVVTADCVPIVCRQGEWLGAIHAGWRGLVAGVIKATLRTSTDPAGESEAWIGPAIGPCCYEVGTDVADQVVAQSSSSIASRSTPASSHLDLQLAAEIQLKRLGVQRIHRVRDCTKCHPDLLWSYRGQPDKRGRNLAIAWLSPA